MINNNDIINLLTPKEVSEILKLGMTNTYKLFKLKGFPKIKIGKKYFIDEKELKKFLKEHSESQIFLN